MTEILNLNINSPISCHAWNKDKTQLALSLNSKEVLIYSKSGNSWKLNQTLTEHSAKVLSIDWAPQSNRIVTCGADKNAYVWSHDGRVWKPELVVLRTNRAATCVKWSPNEKKFAVGCGNRCICICYFEPVQLFWVSKHIKKQLRSTTLCLDWHPNSALIAAGGTDFKCRIFGAYVSEVDGPLNHSSPWAATIKPSECISEFSALNQGWVYSCGFSFDGNILAFVAHDSTVYMVDASRNPQELLTLRTPFLPFLTMKFISNTSIIAAGHDCVPVVFGLNGNKISLLEKLEVSPVQQTSSIATAKNLFGNRERLNMDQAADTTLNSIHQNSIKDLNVYKQEGNKVVQISTSGLDGNMVIWDLNSLEKQFDMPITYLFKLPITIDQIPQYRETLEKRIQSLKPRQLNQFQVQDVVYQATNQTVIHQFLHSDYSSTCFSLIETPSSNKEVSVLTGDIGLASLQRRILDGEKKAMQLDLIGSAFKLGDFQIKIGAVTQNSSNRGLLVEISYCASNNNDAYGVIIEFVESHLGLTNSYEMLASFVKKKPPSANYTPEDTIFQYYEHFNSLRSQTSQLRSQLN